jgi:hypothetical protein
MSPAAVVVVMVVVLVVVDVVVVDWASTKMDQHGRSTWGFTKSGGRMVI